MRQSHPQMSGPARWARPPLDYHTHLLLPEGNHPVGVLKAHCGTVLPKDLTLSTGVITQEAERTMCPGLGCRPDVVESASGSAGPRVGGDVGG